MGIDVESGSFVWNKEKERQNQQAHGLDFVTASEAFFDPDRMVAADETHSQKEKRFFCIGKAGHKIATVRFTYRGEQIRIIGAGFWRKGRKFYEEKNKKNK